jgi:hypothetical protein
MDCPRDLARDELIERYLNGQLQPTEQDEFEVHLLECGGCQQTLGLLQAVRDDLAQQAHGIRTSSGSQPARLPWQWALAFAVVVVCGLGIIEWTNLHKKPEVTIVAPTQLPLPPSQATSTPLVSSGNSAQESGAPARPDGAQRYLSKKLEDTAPRTDHPREIAPSAAREPDKTAVDEVPVLASENPIPTSANPGLQPGGTTRPRSRQAMESISAADDETAIELYKLGMVKPPPYTFASFAASGKAPKGDATKGYFPKEPVQQSNRAVFRNAMVAYAKGHYDDATRLLEDAVNTEPDAPDVNFYLGICKLLQGHPADSLSPLQKALNKSKRDSTIPQAAHFYLAKAYLQAGDLAKTETELKAAGEIAGPLQAEAVSDLSRLQAVRAAKQKPSNP